jgi:hypothetical protein
LTPVKGIQQQPPKSVHFASLWLPVNPDRPWQATKDIAGDPPVKGLRRAQAADDDRGR